MDLMDKQLGAEDQVKVSLEGGKLVISNSYAGKQVSADLVIKADAKAFLEQLKAAIPGNWDDLVINIVEGALP
jgi:hypothetical protein